MRGGNLKKLPPPLLSLLLDTIYPPPTTPPMGGDYSGLEGTANPPVLIYICGCLTPAILGHRPSHNLGKIRPGDIATPGEVFKGHDHQLPPQISKISNRTHHLRVADRSEQARCQESINLTRNLAQGPGRCPKLPYYRLSGTHPDSLL